MNRRHLKLINIDRPITKKSADRLGYRVFAETLAKIISGQPTGDGYVISVDGPWGSGKTSAVSMALEHLRILERDVPVREKSVIVHFRPWIFSGQHNLVTEFFSVMTLSLRRSLGEEVASALSDVKDATVGHAASIFSALALIAASGGQTSVATTAAVSGKVLKVKARSPEATLEMKMEKLRKALSKQSRRVVVVIDDIDRLRAEEMQLMLGMLKSVADLPHVTYVLPANLSVIREAVGSHDQESDISYVEKIIQVNLKLPSPSRSGLDTMFSEGIRALSQDASFDEEDLQSAGYYIFMGYIRSPRNVSQLMNALAVSWEALKGEVYFPDLLCLEAIRLFEPEVFNFIRSNGSRVLSLNSQSNDQGALRKEIEDLTRKKESRHAIGLIGQVLPLYGSSTSSNEQSAVVIGRRMKHDDGFDLYVRWTNDPDVVSLSELREFDAALRGEGDPSKVVATLSRRRANGGASAANSLLDAISDGSVLPTNPALAIVSLLENYHEITSEQNNTDFLLSSHRRLDSALSRLVSSIPYAERPVAIQNVLLSQNVSIDAGAALFRSFIYERKIDQPMMPSQVRDLALEWQQRRITANAFMKSETPAGIVSIVATSVGKPAAKALVDPLLNNRTFLKRLALDLMSRVRSSSKPKPYRELTRAPDSEIYDLKRILESLKASNGDASQGSPTDDVRAFTESLEKFLANPGPTDSGE